MTPLIPAVDVAVLFLMPETKYASRNRRNAALFSLGVDSFANLFK
jgi:hypothetical protein